jgi:choline dehydrogenase-like flavoprotein
VAREILRAPPLRDIVREEIVPGPVADSDAARDAYVRKAVRTDFHPVGTCRMGRADDAMAVVTDDLRVRGVTGLRVIDASVMPRIVSANTNAPTMAVADRAVTLMREVGSDECGRKFVTRNAGPLSTHGGGAIVPLQVRSERHACPRQT